MITTIEGKEYEIISFGSKITNKNVEMRGFAFAKSYLAVAGSDHNFRIYNTLSGEPLLRGRFLLLSDALKIAQILEDKYSDWFEIWESYPKANIISWCKYSVDAGAAMFECFEILDKLENISHQDILDAWKQGKILAEKWRA